MPRLLLVDDDPSLRTSVAEGLALRGYDVASVPGAAAARGALAGTEPFDLILLDITMPGESGTALLEDLRRAEDGTPVILLTALGSLEDRVAGLRLGADDYVVKPFEFEELIARCEAILRRHRPPVLWAIGPVTVNLTARRATRGERDLGLSEREFDLLATLIEAGGEPLSRRTIVERAFGMHFDPGTNIVDVVVMRLRRKLDAGGGHAIRTVTGVGYGVRAIRVKE